MWGDPAAIERLAATCAATGADIAEVTLRAGRSGSAVEWHSTAAGSFQHRLAAFGASANRCCGEFAQAADDLRHHAATVRARIEEIQRLEREAARLAEEAAQAVVDGGRAVARGAGHAAGRALHAVGSLL